MNGRLGTFAGNEAEEVGIGAQFNDSFGRDGSVGCDRRSGDDVQRWHKPYATFLTQMRVFSDLIISYMHPSTRLRAREFICRFIPLPLELFFDKVKHETFPNLVACKLVIYVEDDN